MRTPQQNLFFEMTEGKLFFSKRYKFEFIAATDIFQITVFKKTWLGGWKRIIYVWGFSGKAIPLLHWLNEWLEVFDEIKEPPQG